MKRRKRKIKLGVSGVGIGLSVLLTFSGWNGYSKELALKYEGYISKGIEFRNQLDFNSAIKEFNKAQEYMGGKREGYHEIVKTHMAQWSLDEGLRYLNQTLRKKNDDYTNYLFGKLYFLKSNYDEALSYFNKINNKEKVDKDFEELKVMSKELIDLDKVNSNVIKTSLNRFEKFIDENSGDKVMALNLYLATSDIYFQVAGTIENSIDKQIEILNKAEKISVDNYVVLDRLATAYMMKANSIRRSDIEKYNGYLNKSLKIYYRCLEI